MINKLVDYLKKCDDAYYNGNAIITDDTYDALVNSLRKLDPDNIYLNKVGAKPGNLSKIGRLIPMGTLSKYHDDNEVKEWVSRENSNSYMIEPKYDGFGVELIYKDGILVSAGTRGDGNVGEDVLASMLLIDTVPKELPDKFNTLTIVRGEAIIPRKNHKYMKDHGYEAMRNAVPGIVRSCNKDYLPCVDYVAYEFFDGDTDRVAQINKYSEVFNVGDYEVYSTFEDLLDCRNKFGTTKDSFKYEVDGTVIKTVEIRNDNLLCPEHQIAWKFKSNRRETVLRSIEFQMGVTGKFTPIGIFDPVEFQGAKLSRASFGSIYRLRDLAPKIGCIVEVSRRGDIIPYIESVVSTDVPGCEDLGDLSVCPYCGEKLNPVDGSCINVKCPEKLFLQIRNYVACLGVKGIGPSLVRSLVDKGYITCLSDIYNVTSDMILSIPRQGQSAVDKWNQLVNKNIRLIDFLSALPFDNFGPKVWDTLINNSNINDLLSIDSIDRFNEVFNGKELKGIGQTKVESFVTQMSLYKDDINNLITKVNII